MLEFFKENKKIVIILIIIIILVIGYFYTSKEEKIIEENQILVSNENNNENDTNSEIIVHIAGAVKKQGIVKLQEGSRIEDAIELAGGLSEDADITNINLAYVLEDGTKIRIPSKKDEDTQKEQYIIEDSGLKDDESNLNNNSNNIININKADQTELENLPGIGPSLATRIIEYRKENGNFKSIEDIKNVSGIGDSKFENIKSYIKVQ